MINPNTAAMNAFKNKSIIDFSTYAGCYHCLAIFEAKEINQYTDSGKTAICPKCGIDTVLGDSCMKIDATALKEINDFWFTKKSVVKKEEPKKDFKLP